MTDDISTPDATKADQSAHAPGSREWEIHALSSALADMRERASRGAGPDPAEVDTDVVMAHAGLDEAMLDAQTIRALVVADSDDPSPAEAPPAEASPADESGLVVVVPSLEELEQAAQLGSVSESDEHVSDGDEHDSDAAGATEASDAGAAAGPSPLALLFRAPEPTAPAPTAAPSASQGDRAESSGSRADSSDPAAPADVDEPPDRARREGQRSRRSRGKRGQKRDAEQEPKSEDPDGPDAQDSDEVTVSAESGKDSAERGKDTAEDEEPRVGDEADEDSEDADDAGDGRGRRRRRGGRGRRRRGAGDAETVDEGTAPDQADTEGTAAEDTDSSADEVGHAGDEDSEDDDTDAGSSSGSRRRRRRRRKSGGGEDASPDDPPNTVTKLRANRHGDEVTGVKGSTRLEAKRQRRREGREHSRRRPIITEAEFLARRESVERTMLVREHQGRTQLVVLEDGIVVEHYVARKEVASLIGNVYLGKVQNVLPSMEAAFVDIGRGRNAVLYAGEVNWDAAGMGGQQRRIELALKAGDPVLAQVSKDPVGHKGARLTSQVSLPGRYLVLVPGASMTGISRKLPDKERSRLKKILREVVPADSGVIVRTAAEGASEDELRRDVERLTVMWERMQKRSKAVSAPSLLHGEPDLTVRVVRDVFNEDFSALTAAGHEAFSTVKEYVDQVAPDLAERVHEWDDERDLFEAYRVDEQIAKGLERKVWLPSGGSLVIDRTEAMTVVDVNTGRFVGAGGNLEETVTRNNLEAAEEIVRQLRLRDIGGIIVVDFIDMVLEANRDLVLRRLVECLGRDRTKHQVAEVTSLGLVQMTRKRVGQGLLEAFSEPCEHCAGRGVLIHDLPVEHSGGGPMKSPSKPEIPRGAAEAQRVAEAARKAKGRAAAETAAPASSSQDGASTQIQDAETKSLESKSLETENSPAPAAGDETVADVLVGNVPVEKAPIENAEILGESRQAGPRRRRRVTAPTTTVGGGEAPALMHVVPEADGRWDEDQEPSQSHDAAGGEAEHSSQS